MNKTKRLFEKGPKTIKYPTHQWNYTPLRHPLENKIYSTMQKENKLKTLYR